ncbi:MAG: efflux RND transporter periplasmic adaptor subunit [Lautropia sp.]|nr:efflux RND transporter periplasmic adaptor subunit [Lautropia sp.]
MKKAITASPISGLTRTNPIPASRLRNGLILTLLAASLAACNQGAPNAQGGDGAAAGAAQQPPKLPVGVVTVQYAPVGLIEDLPGRIEASRTAQIRARAAGILEKRVFQEGTDVKEGELLFKIDAAPYQAALNSAKATLARAQTNVTNTKRVVDRYTPLIKANAVSRQDYDNAVAAYKAAQAEVGVAQAAVKTADINLSYANVTSPISGRIGRALVTEGALVGQGDATPLATVQQIDPVYVNITQPASTVMRLKRGLESGQLKQAGKENAASVRVRFDDGSVYEHKGKLLFTDLTVDPNTNQMAVRAEVPNPNGELLPGMYVRAELEQAQIPEAILLPQQAVTRTNTGDSVTVVAADGTMAPRNIKIGGSRDNHWVVLEGLKNGEQVMVDGFQLVQMMGVKVVTPVPWKPGQNTQAGAQPGAGAAADGAAGSGTEGHASAEGANAQPDHAASGKQADTQ